MHARHIVANPTVRARLASLTPEARAAWIAEWTLDVRLHAATAGLIEPSEAAVSLPGDRAQRRAHLRTLAHREVNALREHGHIDDADHAHATSEEHGVTREHLEHREHTRAAALRRRP